LASDEKNSAYHTSQETFLRDLVHAMPRFIATTLAMKTLSTSALRLRGSFDKWFIPCTGPAPITTLQRTHMNGIY
jgi:hypothetical protein